MKTDLTYFSQPGGMTDPGPHAGKLDGLPGDIGELCTLVQGTTVHVFWAERYGLKLPGTRKAEVQLRSLERRLARMAELDPRPLTAARPPETRIVGNCRDFTQLLVAILRHQGVPARARCGFAVYFRPDHFEDHWVAEYWNAAQNRWILVDAQLDELQRQALRLPFDPLDVPADQFIFGGRAWQMCRREGADPDKFGIFDMHGLGFVRGDFIRDVAALNKVELLPWDCWGLIEKEALDNPDDLALLDRLADLTAGDVPDFDALRALYEGDPRLTVGNLIHSYVDGGVESVSIKA